MPRLWPIPISAGLQQVHVHADRRLAFQVLTAFGGPADESGASTRAASAKEASTRVLAEQEGRRLVEFHTPVQGLFGRRKVYRTVEWVTTREPERVDFEGVEGPLPLLRDRFTLEERGGCTLFGYESTFGVRGWWLGWAVGMIYVRPTMRRFIRRHLEELKETIEERARRSKVYPQQPCIEATEVHHGG